MRIRLIRQVDEEGCGVACLATMTRRIYHYIRRVVTRHHARAGKRRLLTWHKHLERVLRRMQYRYERRPFRGWRRSDGDAIVPVNRRRNGAFHWVVVVNGGKRPHVLDPCPCFVV